MLLSRPLSLFRISRAFPSSQLSIAARGAPLDIHPEVEEALAKDRPIVALETALVTHGVPYPHNLELATDLENIVRSTGAIPATIGLVGGRVKIGLEKNELQCLSDTANSRPFKVSRRDIAPAIATGAHGGTTCSATLIFAAMAGIKVFSTGGLGGVHRGGQDSMDVSADLHELTRCPVGLVSSGVKSILDIGRTLEYLETLGVPVITYGPSREFPAFFSRRSGCEAPWNITDPMTAASVLHTQWQLGFQNGALIAVPIPPEFEEAGLAIQKAVDQAVSESEVNGISKRGKEATPWLLSRVLELTSGSSLASNIALIKNTALVGGKIAVSYRQLQAENEARSLSELVKRPPLSDHAMCQEEPASTPSQADLLIVGSAAIDITAQPRSETGDVLTTQSTAPGFISLSLGGVARNIAEAAHRVTALQPNSTRSPCVLVSPVGDDVFGRLLEDETAQLGMRIDGFVKSENPTAVCNVVLGADGSLLGGIAAMDITANLAGDTVVSKIQELRPSLVAMDGNLNPESIRLIVRHCTEQNIRVFFEPTSVIKSAAILPAIADMLHTVGTQAPISFCSPNVLELIHLDQACRGGPLDLYSHPAWWQTLDNLNLGSAFRQDLEKLARKPITDGDSPLGTLAFLADEGIVQRAVRLLPFFHHLVIKCGDRGVVVVMRIPLEGDAPSAWEEKHSQFSQRCVTARGNANEIVVVQHFSPLPIAQVVNVTGAGDSFVGVLLASLLQDPAVFQNPRTLGDTIDSAQNAAILALQSNFAVSPILSEARQQ